MEKSDFKNKVYGELAKVTRAMANPHRMEILDLLAQGPYSVETIAVQVNMSIANTSQHLQVLKGARLVRVSRKGNYIYYQLSGEKVFNAWRGLRDLGIQSNAEVERLMRDYRKGGHDLHPVGMEELIRKLGSGDVVLLDVRPPEEYQKGHIQHAISIPLDQLAQRLNELPRQNEIIAYCRGPLCVYADDAVALLREKGFSANRMQDGYPDWAATGLPIEINE